MAKFDSFPRQMGARPRLRWDLRTRQISHSDGSGPEFAFESEGVPPRDSGGRSRRRSGRGKGTAKAAMCGGEHAPQPGADDRSRKRGRGPATVDLEGQSRPDRFIAELVAIDVREATPPIARREIAPHQDSAGLDVNDLPHPFEERCPPQAMHDADRTPRLSRPIAVKPDVEGVVQDEVSEIDESLPDRRAGEGGRPTPQRSRSTT